MIKGKHHIAQTTDGAGISEEESAENAQNQNEESTEKKSSFSQGEILNMEEKTLAKKIDIDLKVLAKIENEKNPDGGKFHFKIVKVRDESEGDSKQKLAVEEQNQDTF